VKRYQEAKPMSRDAAEQAFGSSDIERICDALVRVSFHDPDTGWVQERLGSFAKHGSAQVRGLAAACFGHLARLHGRLDKA